MSVKLQIPKIKSQKKLRSLSVVKLSCSGKCYPSPKSAAQPVANYITLTKILYRFMLPKA